MIPIVQINNLSNRFGVPADTVEKDYIISWVLICLANSQISRDFVFYGGTAIKRIYFEDHRFSEDIDLISEAHFTEQEILKGLSCLQMAKSEANISLTVDPKSVATSKERLQLRIQYSGFDEISNPAKLINVDFVMARDLFDQYDERNILESYDDIAPYNSSLRVMRLNMILANKLGMLLDVTRNEPRDIFDIWFLLQRKTRFRFEIGDVRYCFKKKYGFLPHAKILCDALDNPGYLRKWQTRLCSQVANLPVLGDVIKDIKSELTSFW